VNALLGIILFGLAIAIAVLAIVFIIVPLLKGLVWLISNVFKGVGWLIQHIFSYIFGTIGDVIRFTGSILAMIVLAPMVPLNVVIGRWSAAGHFGESVKRECKVAMLCLYRVVLQRPLKLVLLHGLLEGIEQRVPEALAAAPTSDRPNRRTGTFDGYTIVGSLRGGGSGGKLYIAEPNGTGRTARRDMPERVVIKSFALTDGSSLPQIVRESRALEAARKLGLVLDHSLNDHRFWYVMPYHSGDNLGIVARQLHAEASERGLTEPQLRRCMTYFSDLLRTVSQYHRGGLWHKDIKPENVIINESGAHLVDLGLVTPLRSAMTLTTHGTEYFRDPEMVRMALRGAKVHQVDGAKFDIFALGAVLYFVLENTFPAHGALSRFTRRSPEALRWIVRRAMADYNKRYDSVDLVAADLETVMCAADPFAVKPAELPSMGGADIQREMAELEQDDDPSAAAASVESAGSPNPPRGPRAVGFGAGIDGKGPFARFGRGDFDDHGDVVREAHESGGPRRPKLKVTNWWTGRYAVDFADAERVSIAPPMHELRRTARNSAHQARRAAREQIQSARTRAREMRQRAAKHRTRATAERQPTLAVMLTSLIVLGGIGLIALSIFMGTRNSSKGAWVSEPAVATPPVYTAGPPLLVINDVRNPGREAAQQRVNAIIDSWREDGYDVVTSDLEAEAAIRPLYERWQEAPDGPADRAIEDALESFNYYGILHITQKAHAHGPADGIWAQRIYAERDGAQDRRRSPEHVLATASKPVILINDHPDGNEPRIRRYIDHLIHERVQDGYTVITDDSTMTEALLPLFSGPRGVRSDATHSLAQRLLENSGYVGVLYISEGSDAGPVEARVESLFIELPKQQSRRHSDQHVSTAVISDGFVSSEAQVTIEPD